MNNRSALWMAAGLIAGCATMATMAACTPDPTPAPVVSVEAPPVVVDPVTDSRFVLIDDVAYALRTPCPEEDSPDCYWDASTRGNGVGTSFVNIGGNILPFPEGH